jgi:hypothetical protein
MTQQEIDVFCADCAQLAGREIFLAEFDFAERTGHRLHTKAELREEILLVPASKPLQVLEAA